jgi:murein DD-endopeptidase MepM/ murein hydrolase activator NlpD
LSKTVSTTTHYLWDTCPCVRSLISPPGLVLLCGALAASVVLAAPAEASHPWEARRPAREPVPAHQLRTTSTWPAEPALPAVIDPERFRASLVHLCGRRGETVGAVIATDLLASANKAGVDPFLLAGLVFFQSACNPALTSPTGTGLLRLDRGLYASAGAPRAPVEREEWAQRNLLDPRQNLEIGARLLRMWQDAHAELDQQFKSVPHRNAVAHFVWGDDVRSSGQEDLILTARRRMVANYNATPDETRTTSLGMTIVSPLEGIPRVATSGPGEERDGGARQHRGLDITAAIGEPVRTIADGVVIYAGANLGKGVRGDSIPPSKIGRYTNRQLGAGGIYVCIQHDSERKIVSCYMHLSTYRIAEGDRVTSGETIGFVGRTGVKVSPPHLHFEIRVDDRFTNPARYLADLVIPPKATMTHIYVMKRARLRAMTSAARGRV